MAGLGPAIHELKQDVDPRAKLGGDACKGGIERFPAPSSPPFVVDYLF